MITPTGDTVIVAWEANREIGVRRRIDGRWESVAKWRPLKASEATYEVAMDGAGNATFTLLRRNSSIAVKQWPHDGAMGEELTILSPPTGFSYRSELRTAAGAAGGVLVGTFIEGQRSGRVVTLFQPRNGPWGPERLLGQHMWQPGYRLAVGQSGVGEAVWETGRDNDERMTIRFSKLTLG